MDNQHKKITGYRDLTKEEIALMNEAKALEAQVNGLVDRLRSGPESVPGEGLRHLSIGATQIETGFMFLVKAIARPVRQTVAPPERSEEEAH